MAAEQVWSVKAALDWTTTFLAEKADEHPRRSAEWLLSAATGLSRVELYAFHDRPLSDYRARDAARGRPHGGPRGEPLQYVTGEVAFRHLVLKVRPGVLIPRPETEVLVDTVLPAVRRAVDGARSGGRGRPVHGFGLRRTFDRLGVSGQRRSSRPTSRRQPSQSTAENAARLGLDDVVTTLPGDLFSALPEGERGTLDVIVSNPPYIPSADVPTLPCRGCRALSRASHWTAEPTASTSTGGFSQVDAGGCGRAGFWRSNSTKEWCGKRPRKR